MILPTFALTVPRPWTHLIASGLRHDWVVRADPKHLVGGLVALCTAAEGDAEGWRRFDVRADGKISRKQVAEACPNDAIIGLAVVEAVVPFGRFWRVHFGRSAVISAIGPMQMGGEELWPIPASRREQIRRVFLARPSRDGVASAH